MVRPDDDPALAPADLTVPLSAAGERLDAVTATLMPSHSRSRLQRWIAAGFLTVDGVTGRAKDRLHGGERLVLALPADTLADLEVGGVSDDVARVVAEDLPTGIVYEDTEIFIVDKPAGVVMHPAPGHPRGTLMNALLHRDPALRHVPRAGIVHRLDRDTTGLCVIARTLEAHTALVRQLQARRMGRRYVAIVVGDPGAAAAGDSGTVDAPIGRDPRERKRMAVTHGGKPAVTHWTVAERLGAATRLDVRLETGRTHQIRVHLTHIGHPLIGDPVYQDNRVLATTFRSGSDGRTAVDAFERQALHATRLTLEHPADGRTVSFDAPMPEDMRALYASLKELAP